MQYYIYYDPEKQARAMELKERLQLEMDRERKESDHRSDMKMSEGGGNGDNPIRDNGDIQDTLDLNIGTVEEGPA